MAFVYRSKRSPSLSNSSLGPGFYNNSSAASSRQQYAPFNSRSSREGSLASKAKVPGPGQYQKDQFSKVLLVSAKHNLKVIERPKQSYIFSSDRGRFQSQKPLTPGPGQYLSQESWVKSGSSRGSSRWGSQKLSQHKSTSVPSIPSNPFSFQFVERKDQPKEKPANMQSNTKPGECQSRVRGLPWCRIKDKRVLFSSSSNREVGPGTYQLAQPKTVQTTRPILLKSSSRLTSRLKGQKGLEKRRIFLLSNNTDSLQQKIQFLESLEPGPGYYYNQEAFKSIKKKTTPEEFQCFGSTCQRFRTNEQSGVGPGDYMVLQREQKKQNKQVCAGFNSTQQRFFTLKLTNEPSPAHYSYNQTIGEEVKRNVMSRTKAIFGSGRERFQAQTPETTPGPWAYDPPEQPKREITSVFKTFTKRPTTTGLMPEDKVNDIKIKSYKLYQASGRKNRVKPKEKAVRKRAPFNVTMQRFAEAKEERETENDSLNEIGVKNAQTRHQTRQAMRRECALKRHFNSTETRFRRDYFLSPTRRERPGPGDYEPKETFKSGTHNVLFS